jgi:hypothetical protein
VSAACGLAFATERQAASGIGDLFRHRTSRYNESESIDNEVKKLAAASPQDILMPGGSPIGTSGSQPAIREVSGSLTDAEQMFDDLIRGGTAITDPKYPGKRAKLAGGGTVGLRPASKSGRRLLM